MRGTLWEAAVQALRDYVHGHPAAVEDLAWAEADAAGVDAALYSAGSQDDDGDANYPGDDGGQHEPTTGEPEIARETCDSPEDAGGTRDGAARETSRTAAAETPRFPATGAVLAVRDGTLALPPTRVVTDEAGLRPALAALAGAPLIGVDTETTGLDPRRGRLRLLQFATPEAVYVLDIAHLGRAAELVRPWLADLGTRGAVLAGHNLAFDLQFLRVARLVPDDPLPVFDGMSPASC